MTEVELMWASLFVTIVVVCAVVAIANLTDGPDPMEEEHGDVPHIPEVHRD